MDTSVSLSLWRKGSAHISSFKITEQNDTSTHTVDIEHKQIIHFAVHLHGFKLIYDSDYIEPFYISILSPYDGY